MAQFSKAGVGLQGRLRAALPITQNLIVGAVMEGVNELVNLEFGAFPSLKRRGGCAIDEMDPFRNGAAGVVSSAKSFRPGQFAELTTPSAALR